MRILMIARNLVTDMSAPRYTLELSRELVKLHNEVFILASNIKASVENAKILKMPAKYAKKLYAPFFYSFFAKKIKAKYDLDIVHGNGYTLFDDVTTVHFLSKAFRRQLERFNITNFLMNKSELIKEKANEVILRFSKHLIAVSSLVQRDLEENYGIPKDNITVVHNGVNLQDFFPPSYNEKEKLQQKYGFDKSKISLLFIGGSAYERKGFRFLCKALPQISKDVTIIAVCRRLSKEYRKILSDNALDERVKIIEYVPNISEIYRAVDIYALPTIYDPFPLATLEAMASGLPVVISSFAGSTDIIKDWKNGIIIDDPRNVMKLATLINKLAESDSMRKFMGSNARETVERLSWSNVARKIMEVYEIAARR